jgi:hypothetical protein
MMARQRNIRRALSGKLRYVRTSEFDVIGSQGASLGFYEPVADRIAHQGGS